MEARASPTKISRESDYRLSRAMILFERSKLVCC